MIDYKKKYLKYKKKYLNKKKIYTGGSFLGFSPGGMLGLSPMTPQSQVDMEMEYAKGSTFLAPVPLYYGPANEPSNCFETFSGRSFCKDLEGISSPIDLLLDRIKIVFWCDKKQYSAECLDLSSTPYDNILSIIKWISDDRLLSKFGYFNTGTRQYIGLATTYKKGISSAMRFYLELVYLKNFTEGKSEKKELRCDGYGYIITNVVLLKYYDQFCKGIEAENVKLVGGQRLNAFLLYLYKNIDPTTEVNSIPPEAWDIFCKILGLGHSDFDFTLKPDILTEVEGVKDEGLSFLDTEFFAHSVVTTNTNRLKAGPYDQESIKSAKTYQDFEKCITEFMNKDSILYKIKEDLKNAVDSYVPKCPPDSTLEAYLEDVIPMLLGHPMIFNLSEECDRKRVNKLLPAYLEAFTDRYHLPQQKKKIITRILTTLVSASFLLMHMERAGNDKDAIETYITMIANFIQNIESSIPATDQLAQQAQQLAQQARALEQQAQQAPQAQQLAEQAHQAHQQAQQAQQQAQHLVQQAQHHAQPKKNFFNIGTASTAGNTYLQYLIHYLSRIVKDISCSCGKTGLKLMRANTAADLRNIKIQAYFNGIPTKNPVDMPIDPRDHYLPGAMKGTRNRIFIPGINLSHNLSQGLLNGYFVLELDNDNLGFTIQSIYTGQGGPDAIKVLDKTHREEDYRGELMSEADLDAEIKHIYEPDPDCKYAPASAARTAAVPDVPADADGTSGKSVEKKEKEKREKSRNPYEKRKKSHNLY